MPLRHGQKFYCQLLLDHNRYLLVEAMAMQQGKRTTALLREMVYDALERALPASEYRAAEAADYAAWTDSVKRRVQGRQRSRQEAEVASTQQSS
jgi:hypothetical protein